ncbi:hypothetical protein ABKN59_007719 [Abortiporus biennis]
MLTLQAFDHPQRTNLEVPQNSLTFLHFPLQDECSAINDQEIGVYLLQEIISWFVHCPVALNFLNTSGKVDFKVKSQRIRQVSKSSAVVHYPLQHPRKYSPTLQWIRRMQKHSRAFLLIHPLLRNLMSRSRRYYQIHSRLSPGGLTPPWRIDSRPILSHSDQQAYATKEPLSEMTINCVELRLAFKVHASQGMVTVEDVLVDVYNFFRGRLDSSDIYQPGLWELVSRNMQARVTTSLVLVPWNHMGRARLLLALAFYVNDYQMHTTLFFFLHFLCFVNSYSFRIP